MQSHMSASEVTEDFLCVCVEVDKNLPQEIPNFWTVVYSTNIIRTNLVKNDHSMFSPNEHKKDLIIFIYILQYNNKL